MHLTRLHGLFRSFRDSSALCRVKAGQAFLPLLPLHKVLLRGLPVETPIARRRLESQAEAWKHGPRGMSAGVTMGQQQGVAE